MTAEEAFVMARENTRRRCSMIQGFTYGRRHVVRDTLRHPDDQELWSEEWSDEQQHSSHARMMETLEVAKSRIVLAELAALGFEVRALTA